MGEAVADLKRITLELVGNDPDIVHRGCRSNCDSDAIFEIAFANARQVCKAIKRVYVHGSLCEAFCAELARFAEAAQLGDDLEQGTAMGPFRTGQYDRVLDLIRDLRAHGRIIAGGEAPPNGEAF